MSDFHRTLNDISKHIDSNTLKNMKYMCRGVVVPAKMEEIKCPLDLLRELEECNKIYDGNVQFLISLLVTEKKFNLVDKLVPLNGLANETLQESLSLHAEQYYEQTPALNLQIPSQLSLTNKLPQPGENFPCGSTIYSPPQSGAEYSCNMDEQNRAHSLAVTNRDILATEKQPHNGQATSHSLFTSPYHSSPVTRRSAGHAFKSAGYYGRQPFNSSSAETPNTPQEAHNISESMSVPSLQHHTKGEVAYSLRTSTNMVNEQHSVSTPCGSSSRIVSKEALLSSENIGAQQMFLASPQPTHVKEPAIDQQSQIQNQSQFGACHGANGQPATSDIHNENVSVPTQAEDDEINLHMESQITILTKQMEMVMVRLQDQEKRIDQRHCDCGFKLLYQKSIEENESLHQQLLQYKQLYQQEVEKAEKLKHTHSQGCPTRAVYQMNKSPHGIAVIITNCEFYSAKSSNKLLPNSRGTNSDSKNLFATWSYLCYVVRVFKNLTASELTHQLMQIASQNHENYDSFVCCILSHSCSDGVYGTDGEIVKVSDIANLFKYNSTLADKPKLFFIYTCCEFAGKKAVAVAPENPCHCLPSEADFFFCCSFNMSWWIRSKYISMFHEVTKRYAVREHLLNLLTIIDYKMLELSDTQGCESEYCPIINVNPVHKEVWFFAR